MNKEFDEFVDSIWEEREKPDKITSAQIWTVFAPQASQGTIVLILRKSESEANVLLLHHEKIAKRGIDIQLNSDHLDFHDNLVVLTDSSMTIHLSAFETGRYLGRINNQGLDLILKGIARYNDISGKLTRCQAMHESGEPSDDQFDELLSDGILDLVPRRVSHEEFNELKSRLLSNVLVKDSQVSSLADPISQAKKLYQEFINTPASELDRDARIKYIEEKWSIFLPFLLDFCKSSKETAVSASDYEIAYHILFGLCKTFPDNLEIAKLLKETASITSASLPDSIKALEVLDGMTEDETLTGNLGNIIEAEFMEYLKERS